MFRLDMKGCEDPHERCQPCQYHKRPKGTKSPEKNNTRPVINYQRENSHKSSNLLALNLRTQHDFAFESDATGGFQTLDEDIAQRAGGCQDPAPLCDCWEFGM